MADADVQPDAPVASGEPPVAPLPPMAAAPLPPPPPPPPAPDGITLTRRELEAHVEKAVARAVEAAQSKAMPDKNPKDPEEPSKDVVAELRKELEAKLETIKAEADARTKELEGQLAEANKKADEEKKARRRAKEKVVEANLRKAAAKAGIEDEDYALVLYARDATAKVGHKDDQGNPAPIAPTDPDEFFASLAKAKPGLVRAAPAAPPARTAPGDGAEPAPPPPPPGKGSTAAGNSGEKSVWDMDHREFSQKTLDQYGYRPEHPV